MAEFVKGILLARNHTYITRLHIEEAQEKGLVKTVSIHSVLCYARFSIWVLGVDGRYSFRGLAVTVG